MKGRYWQHGPRPLLRRLDIADKQWRAAMEATLSAVQNTASTTAYIRFYERDADPPWRARLRWTWRRCMAKSMTNAQVLFHPDQWLDMKSELKSCN